ncbi:MAG: polyprenyl synthetase family protein [Cyanobacteria bacterium]|nr:polyprenyl synthetase family protein [Cyanobacteriota bacterium]
MQTALGNTIGYETFFEAKLQRVNSALKDILTAEKHPIMGPEILWQALQYGTLQGGKRIRPLMVIESCLACGGNLEDALPTACALELVHAQSLIHDDLPCMDNDDLRRGQPTLHKAYSESTAVLAGDALLGLSFGVIAKQKGMPPERLLRVIQEFSNVSSLEGLVNGQFVDIYYEGKTFTPEVLDYIHTYKTAALFRFALQSGAILAGASETIVDTMTKLGNSLGMIFQVKDDLLDLASTPEQLGKTPGKDLAQEKATFPALYGVEVSQQKIVEWEAEADSLLQELQKEGCSVESLTFMAKYLGVRVH